MINRDFKFRKFQEKNSIMIHNELPSYQPRTRVRRIPLEDWQLAAYYGIGDATDYGSSSNNDSEVEEEEEEQREEQQQQSRASSEVPTFHADLPSALFKTTMLLTDESVRQSTELQIAETPRRSSNSEVPTFRANLPSALFKSTLLEDTNQQNEHRQSDDGLPYFLKKSHHRGSNTVSAAGAEERKSGSTECSSSDAPTFRANLPSELFKSTLLETTSARTSIEEVQEEQQQQMVNMGRRKSRLTFGEPLHTIQCYSRASSEAPTFRADLPSALFKSTFLADDSNQLLDQTPPLLQPRKSTFSEAPTFRANLPSALFKSTFLADDSIQPLDQSTPIANQSPPLPPRKSAASEAPTFRANLPSALFKSTLLDESHSSVEMETPRSTSFSKAPIFRAAANVLAPKQPTISQSKPEPKQQHKIVRKSGGSSPARRPPFIVPGPASRPILQSFKNVSPARLVNIFGSLGLNNAVTKANMAAAMKSPQVRPAVQPCPSQFGGVHGGCSSPHPPGHLCSRYMRHQQSFEQKVKEKPVILVRLDEEEEGMARKNAEETANKAAEEAENLARKEEEKKKAEERAKEQQQQRLEVADNPSPRHRIVMIDEDEEIGDEDDDWATEDDEQESQWEIEKQASTQKTAVRRKKIGPSGSIPNMTIYMDEDDEQEENWDKENAASCSTSRMDVDNNNTSVAFSDLFNSPAPKHFRHVVCKEPSPELVYRSKLIRPDPQSPSIVQLGLRRSQRTRLPRLQAHLGQKAVYKVDEQGNQVLVGASEVQLKDRRLKKFRVLDPVVASQMEQDAKYRKRQTKAVMRKRRHERSQYKGKRNLSKVPEEEESEEEEADEFLDEDDE